MLQVFCWENLGEGILVFEQLFRPLENVCGRWPQNLRQCIIIRSLHYGLRAVFSAVTIKCDISSNKYLPSRCVILIYFLSLEVPHSESQFSAQKLKENAQSTSWKTKKCSDRKLSFLWLERLIDILIAKTVKQVLFRWPLWADLVNSWQVCADLPIPWVKTLFCQHCRFPRDSWNALEMDLFVDCPMPLMMERGVGGL